MQRFLSAKNNKHLRMKTFLSILIIPIVILFASCNKGDYLASSGVHNPAYDGTILDYLKTAPPYFDSLVKVIQLAGMEDVLTKETVTFFAPTKQSVMGAVKLLNDYLYLRGRDTITRLEQVDPAVWKDMLSLYVLKDKYLLKDIPQMDTTNLAAYGGQGFVSLQGRPMNVGVIYGDAGGVKYAGYRQLCYSYIQSFENDADAMVNALVSTSNIQPRNGALHILRSSSHVFGFTRSNFVQAAIGKGIRY